MLAGELANAGGAGSRIVDDSRRGNDVACGGRIDATDFATLSASTGRQSTSRRARSQANDVVSPNRRKSCDPHEADLLSIARGCVARSITASYGCGGQDEDLAVAHAAGAGHFDDLAGHVLGPRVVDPDA